MFTLQSAGFLLVASILAACQSTANTSSPSDLGQENKRLYEKNVTYSKTVGNEALAVLRYCVDSTPMHKFNRTCDERKSELALPLHFYIKMLREAGANEKEIIQITDHMRNEEGLNTVHQQGEDPITDLAMSPFARFNDLNGPVWLSERTGDVFFYAGKLNYKAAYAYCRSKDATLPAYDTFLLVIDELRSSEFFQSLIATITKEGGSKDILFYTTDVGDMHIMAVSTGGKHNFNDLNARPTLCILNSDTKKRESNLEQPNSRADKEETSRSYNRGKGSKTRETSSYY